MKTPQEILISHCPSMDSLFLDASGRAFRERVVKAMEEYADQFRKPEKKSIEEMLTGCKEEFRAVLKTWLEYKAEKNQRYKPKGLEALVKKFNNFEGSPDDLQQIIDNCTSCNYAGIVWPKKPTYGQSTKPTRIDIHQSEFERQFGGGNKGGESGNIVVEDSGAVVID